MLEFETLVYLDVQKTGSTFIRTFLRRFVASAMVESTIGAPRGSRKNGALHVISVRHPLSQYISLYSYGCTDNGAFRSRMNRKGHSDLYDGTQSGFTRWLELVLSPESPFAGDEWFCLQTMRFLTLALPKCCNDFEGMQPCSKIKETLSHHGMMDVVIKQESLNDDLLNLATGKHAALFKDGDSIPIYLTEERKINESPKLDINSSDIAPNILSLLQKREWLLFDVFGYSPCISIERTTVCSA